MKPIRPAYPYIYLNEDFSRRNTAPTLTHMIDYPDPARHVMTGDPDKDGEIERGVATKVRPKTKKPSMYRVLLMNDDYTPMEFVVSILIGIFNKSPEDATRIMLNVHQTGIGTCGVYTFEVAETKVAQVLDAAKRNQHPLQCTLEKV